jgi:hypothetical protein
MGWTTAIGRGYTIGAVPASLTHFARQAMGEGAGEHKRGGGPRAGRHGRRRQKGDEGDSREGRGLEACNSEEQSVSRESRTLKRPDATSQYLN